MIWVIPLSAMDLRAHGLFPRI